MTNTADPLRDLARTASAPSPRTTRSVDKRIDQVLSALRRVIHASDQHSRHLARTTGLTSPQILLLQIIRDHRQLTIGELAREMSLCQATVTSILDRLEKRQLVVRKRSVRDRRKVHVHLTEQAEETLKHARIPLQEQLTRQFSHLHEWEQTLILSALQRMADMMDADHINSRAMGELRNAEDIRSEQDKSAPDAAVRSNTG